MILGSTNTADSNDPVLDLTNGFLFNVGKYARVPIFKETDFAISYTFLKNTFDAIPLIIF